MSYCHDCTRQALPGRSRCELCRDRRNKRQAAKRVEDRGYHPPKVRISACSSCGREKIGGSPRCEPCREQWRRKRAPSVGRYAVLCAGSCGRLLRGTASSRPAGERTCHPCRRRRAGLPPDVPGRVSRLRLIGPRPPIACANPVCQRTIKSPRANQKWCARQCRERATPPTATSRERWARKNAKRGPDRGAGWARLRAQVLAEEPDCWICGDEIDPTVKWPAAMCGTGDHVIPLEAGGAHLDRKNVRAAHKVCNQRRHVQWRREQRRMKRAAA